MSQITLVEESDEYASNLKEWCAAWLLRAGR